MDLGNINGFDINQLNDLITKLEEPGQGGVQESIEWLESLDKVNGLNVVFTNNSTNEDPQYLRDGDSGFDLRVNLVGDIDPLIIEAGERFTVPTGLSFNIPKGYEIQVRPRSGLAAKNGITVVNSPGTVDSNYRGEVKVVLLNTDKEKDFIISHGDRIAQAVVVAVPDVILLKADNISEDTNRSTDGFGSTGVV